jgi:hypothetical protein
MKYINPKRNRGIVNKFADHILTEINKLGDYDSVIEISDSGKFIIVNGYTSYDKPLDLNYIKESFINQNPDALEVLGYKDLNLVDLVEYDVSPKKQDDFWFTFYNTSRPTYTNFLIQHAELDNSLSITNDLIYEVNFSNDDIDEVPNFIYPPITITSEFPHGYSLNMGRLHYYYSEYIAHNIMTSINSKKMSFKISTRIDEDEDFMIEIKGNSMYSDEVIKSMVLDVFNFDLESFKHTLSSYNFTDDIDNPFGSKPWLFKDQINNCIIF